jgi:hypothetical protein
MEFIILDEPFVYTINHFSEIRSIDIQDNKHALRYDLIDLIDNVDIKNELLSYTPIPKNDVKFNIYNDIDM